MSNFKPVRIAYNCYEPASGAEKDLAPIIYFHGVTDNKGAWEEIPQVVANATKRIGYTVDARNHGDSEWSEEFNFDMNADDAIHFMDIQKIKKAILVGHSMGGITVIKTALKAPERIEKIVVEDMVVSKIPPHTIDMVLVYIKLLREALDEVPIDVDEYKAKKFIREYIERNTPSDMGALTIVEGEGDSSADGTCFLSLRRDADGRYRFKGNLDVIERSMRDRDTLVREPEGVFKGPACFIYGSLSPMQVGSEEQIIREHFPNSSLHGVNEGHNVHNMKPAEFTDILLKFLS